MAIRHKDKVVYLIFLELKNSSLKIPLLHHAASFITEAIGGSMVKEWDFEAEFFKKILKNLCFMAIIGFFGVIHGVSLLLTTKNSLNESFHLSLQ